MKKTKLPTNVIQFPAATVQKQNVDEVDFDSNTKNVTTHITQHSSKSLVGKSSIGCESDEQESAIVFINEGEYNELVLQVEMDDGSLWNVPATQIADSRANYYSDTADESDYDVDVYVSEFVFTLKNEEALIDWAENNMDWSDVAPFAYQVKPPRNVDYQDGWTNGMKDLIKRK